MLTISELMGFWPKVFLFIVVFVLVMLIIKYVASITLAKQVTFLAGVIKTLMTVITAMGLIGLCVYYFTRTFEPKPDQVSNYWFNWMCVVFFFLFMQGLSTALSKAEDVWGLLTDAAISFVAGGVLFYILADYRHMWSQTQFDVYRVILMAPVYDCIVNLAMAIKLRTRILGGSNS